MSKKHPTTVIAPDAAATLNAEGTLLLNQGSQDIQTGVRTDALPWMTRQSKMKSQEDEVAAEQAARADPAGLLVADPVQVPRPVELDTLQMAQLVKTQMSDVDGGVGAGVTGVGLAGAAGSTLAASLGVAGMHTAAAMWSVPGQLAVAGGFVALLHEKGDKTAPTIAGAQSFDYAENRSAGSTLGTVVASDNVGVTGYRFAATGHSASPDGFYEISSTGVITLTAAGAAAAANDFEISPNSFAYGVEARDAAGNWSKTTNITLNVTNDLTDDDGDLYISIGRLDPEGNHFGAWFDSNQNGVFDAGETMVETLPDSEWGVTYHYSLKDIDFSSGDYTVRFVDAVSHDGTKLVNDLTTAGLVIDEFGVGDRFIVDLQTHADDWMGLAGLWFFGGVPYLPQSPTGVMTGDENSLPGGLEQELTLRQNLYLEEGSDPLQEITKLLDGTYARLFSGTLPVNDRSASPYGHLQFKVETRYETSFFTSEADLNSATQSPANAIQMEAYVWTPYRFQENDPNTPDDDTEQLGGWNGYSALMNPLVTVTGVPLNDTNVTYMLPLFVA